MKVFKKSLAAAAAAAIVFSNFCPGGDKPLIGNVTAVSAENVPSQFSDEIRYDDYLSYQKIYNFSEHKYDRIMISECDESAVFVEIPSEINGLPVTDIGESAFYSCTDLTSVEIPDSVTSIGWNAFSNCTSLKSIEIPDRVTSIGTGAFLGCTGLSSVKIPNKLTVIVECVFQDCTGLTSVEISDRVTLIGSAAFGNCINLTSVKIPDSVTQICGEAFYGCTGLTSITIENPECKIDGEANTICNGVDKDEKAFFSGKIYGYENSTAKAYAEKYSYKFESLGEKPPVTIEPFLPGDTNLNGKIELYDAIWIAEHMAGIRKLTPEQFEAADIDKKNGDGVVNLYDAIRIAEIMAEQRK